MSFRSLLAAAALALTLSPLAAVAQPAPDGPPLPARVQPQTPHRLDPGPHHRKPPHHRPRPHRPSRPTPPPAR